MKSWPAPALPDLPGRAGAITVADSSTGGPLTIEPDGPVRMYVCGITPYDATHLGHAATYVTFDVLGRALRDAGHEVRYVQNITDVDDPLLERAARDGVRWQELATREIDLFREDMTALGVIPPDHFVGVVDSIELIADAVRQLEARGAAYRIPVPENPAGDQDIYLDLASTPDFGDVSGWSREAMMEVFAERGGDPDRAGKRDPLDPLLWRAARPGEPCWTVDGIGSGRPGWHIECTAIALRYLGEPIDIQGGGSDLVFPHHEMSAAQAAALTQEPVFARAFVHQAMVGLDGEKMSKSKGNLVLVSRLRQDGVDPMAIRLVLLAHRHNRDWEYTDADLTEAQERLSRWRAALSGNGSAASQIVVDGLRAALADELNTPAALRVVDHWAAETLGGDTSESTGAGVVARAIDALLGIRL